MIVVVFNKPDFEYDVHSLLKEFFPQEDVQMYYSCLLYTSDAADE